MNGKHGWYIDIVITVIMLVSSKWILGTSNRIIIINNMTRFPLGTQQKVWEKWETNWSGKMVSLVIQSSLETYFEYIYVNLRKN